MPPKNFGQFPEQDLEIIWTHKASWQASPSHDLCRSENGCSETVTWRLIGPNDIFPTKTLTEEDGRIIESIHQNKSLCTLVPENNEFKNLPLGWPSHLTEPQPPYGMPRVSNQVQPVLPNELPVWRCPTGSGSQDCRSQVQGIRFKRRNMMGHKGAAARRHREGLVTFSDDKLDDKVLICNLNMIGWNGTVPGDALDPRASDFYQASWSWEESSRQGPIKARGWFQDQIDFLTVLITELGKRNFSRGLPIHNILETRDAEQEEEREAEREAERESTSFSNASLCIIS